MVSGRLELCMGCEWGLYISLFCPAHPMGDRKDWDLGSLEVRLAVSLPAGPCAWHHVVSGVFCCLAIMKDRKADRTGR